MARLCLYYISDTYIRYLQRFERRILHNVNSKRPYCGIILMNHQFSYFIPLSSPKEKYKKIRNRMDVEKIWNGECGILNLNNMIPVPEQFMQRIDIDTIEDIRYKVLLRRQADYIRNNSEKIRKKTEKLYKLIKHKNPRNVYEESILSRCCDLDLLEGKCLDLKEIQTFLSLQLDK